MTKSQRKATILGRLVGMSISIYIWFFLNNNGSNYPIHKSVIVAFIEDESADALTVFGVVIVSTLILTIISGVISRLLFSFGGD